MNLAAGGLRRTVALLHDPRTVASGWKEVGRLKRLTKRVVQYLIGSLLVSGLLLLPASPARAGADVFFGLTIGIPFAPYPVYAPVYAPPAVIYAYPPGPVVVVAPWHYHVYGPPYGKAHGHWKKHWKRVHRWHTDD